MAMNPEQPKLGIRIGDFSKLSLVSIKALRLYDQKGLLKPARIDPDTGYRYYSASQLPRLNRILALKDLGFSLEQIGQLLDENLSIPEMQGMLRLKQAEVQQRLAQEQERLVRVEARLKQIQQEATMPDYDVVLKPLQAVQVASIREVIPSYPAVGQLYDELMGHLGSQGYFAKVAHPNQKCMTVWYDEGYKESDVDAEATVFLEAEVQGSDRIQCRTLPAHEQAACLTFNGSYNRITAAYQHLLKWIEDNRYDIVGPNREFYIIGGAEQDNESYVTEIQFPVAKAA